MKDKRLLKAAIKERLYRRRFLVPNVVTLANMFCGFLACIYAAQGFYEKAAISIGFAILLDGLDGRVARKLNATSRFGLEFDSFSDLTSFGIAPAIVMYHWCLKPVASEFGVFVCFIYALCAASRLARFNISAENLKAFTGLPTPGAAAFVASLVSFFPAQESSAWFAILGGSTMVVLGLLMVSQIEFFSIKLLRVKGLGVLAPIVIGAVIGLIWCYGAIGFLVLASAYVLSGPVGAIKRRAIPRKLTPETPSNESDRHSNSSDPGNSERSAAPHHIN